MSLPNLILAALVTLGVGACWVRVSARLRRVEHVSGAWRVQEAEYPTPATWMTDDELGQLVDSWKDAA